MPTGSWTIKLLSILKNIGLLIIASGLGYYFSPHFGQVYGNLFGEVGSYVDLRSLIGLPLAYIFFLILIFTAFGWDYKYWWMAVLLIPAAIVELYVERRYLYFPFLLGLAGWLIGVGLSKLTQKK